MEIFSAIIEIGILYCVIYAILKGARGSRFGQALMGVGILITALALFTYLFHFHVLSLLIRYLLIYFAISSVVIFQPEIRRFLATIGAFGSMEKSTGFNKGPVLTPGLFVEIIKELSENRMGALFAFERGISLRGYEETGTAIDAIISPELITTLFTPPLPLHDGGAIIRNGRLASAHCLFPVSHNPSLARNGMRHRAAVGISEETDAIVVIVSEETGNVSVAHNGKMITYKGDNSYTAVTRWITKALPSELNREGFLPKQLRSLQQLFWRTTKGGRS